MYWSLETPTNTLKILQQSMQPNKHTLGKLTKRDKIYFSHTCLYAFHVSDRFPDVCSLPGGLRPCISGDTVACVMGADPEPEAVVPVGEVIVVEVIVAVEVVSPSISELLSIPL